MWDKKTKEKKEKENKLQQSLVIEYKREILHQVLNFVF